MLPRLRSAHVAVVALACAVAMNHARGEPPCSCSKPKLVQKVYSVADLVVPIGDCDANCVAAPQQKKACEGGKCCLTPCCDDEVMCQQPEESPCCQGGSCCPNGACCPDGSCCSKGGSCQQPVSSCASKGGCCPKSATSYTATAAPECYKKATKARTSEGNAATLIHLIENSIFSKCCPDGDCQCSAEYCPIGMSLVVSAPPCCQEQVVNLLDRLRREQNTEVSFEIRIVRIVDGPAKQEFDQAVGATLDGPMFLCPKKLAAALEAVHTDSRNNDAFCPRATVFNGQKATLLCAQDQLFVTKLDRVLCGGQPMYVPKNEPFHLGFEYAVRPTVSADHRFVRCELNAEFRELAASPVPLYPVTTFVTPIFEGGAQGQSVPFTQFIQQPEVVTRALSKSIMIPDSQTAVFYAGKQTKTEQTNEDEGGAPLFDWINDLVDLVYPPTPPQTYEEHLFVMVTPRIIESEALESQAAAKPMPIGPALASPCKAVCGVGDAPADLAMPIRQCAATAPSPCPAPAVATAPCYPQVQPCPVAPCPTPQFAISAPPAPQVQLDVCIMSIDPAAWDQPLTAAWTDLAPNASNRNAKMISAEESKRFCDSMKAQGAAKLLAQPKLITLSGQPATFLSGGQQAVPQSSSSGEIVGTTFEPFGTQITFLPTIAENGQVRLELEAVMSSLNQSNGYRLGETTVAGRDEHRLRSTMSVCDGQTILMHGGRGQDGRDLMVMVTSHLIESPQAAVYCPQPMAFAPAPAPGPIMPTVWSSPMPVREDVMVAGGQFKPSADQAKLFHLLELYKLACDDGDEAEARKLAKKCLAIDPTCFGR
jgi:hypothetical protein